MVVLHGENLVASGKELSEYRLRFRGEIVELEGLQLNLTQIKQALESPSLFGKDRLIIIRNFLGTPASSEKQKFINYFKENFFKNLILWEGKKINGRILSPLKAQIFQFDLPRDLFRFLDSLTPQNKKMALFYLHQCLLQETPEMILYMIVRQIRLLILAADLGDKGLESLLPWQKYKFLHQARKFDLNQLLIVYRQLLQIDKGQKTGKAPVPLAFQLDLLIASL